MTKKKKEEMFGQMFNSKKGNFGTDFQLYSIYIYAVKLKMVQDLPFLKLKWSKLKVKNWSKFFTVSPIFIVLGGGVCSKTQIVSLCAKIVFSRNCRDVKNQVFE